MALERTNKCYFVGELVEVKDHRLTSYTNKKTGAPVEAISTTIVVKCMINDEENVFALSAFCNKINNDGSTNKNYNKLVNIKELIGHRVVISGARLVGDRFWSKQNEQLVPAQKFDFSMIREANDKESEDKAEFEFSGFVVRELAEKTDNEGNVLYHQMTIGQATYKEDNMFMLDFIVEKDNIAAIQGIERAYPQFTTVSIHGICKNIVTTNTVTEESLFGDPIVKVYTRNDKKLVITGGDQPIQGEGEYTEEHIAALNKAYIAEGNAIKAKAMNADSTPSATVAPSASKPVNKKSALAGMFD